MVLFLCMLVLICMVVGCVVLGVVSVNFIVGVLCMWVSVLMVGRKFFLGFFV